MAHLLDNGQIQIAAKTRESIEFLGSFALNNGRICPGPEIFIEGGPIKVVKK